jgi:hypothetical protein
MKIREPIKRPPVLINYNGTLAPLKDLPTEAQRRFNQSVCRAVQEMVDAQVRLMQRR